MSEEFRAMKDMRAAERERLGVKCPVCLASLPKANPKIMLPGETCRAHKPHYRDPRDRLTTEQWNTAMSGTGWEQE